MPIDLDPRLALSGGPQRVSLIRCRVCKRTDECSPATVMWLMQDGGVRCCAQVMELFVQTTWPGQRPEVAKAPAVPVPAVAIPTGAVQTIAW